MLFAQQTFKLQHLGTETTKFQARSFNRGSLAPLSTLVDNDIIHEINGPGLSPPFLYAASDQKLNGIGRPGNEAKVGILSRKIQTKNLRRPS